MMIHSKLLRQLIGVTLVIMLIGCTFSATPLETPKSTQVSTITPSPKFTIAPSLHPTSTLVEVSNFEECTKAGNPILNTYPRQCNNNGDVFKESLEPEVILAKTYSMGSALGFGPSFTLTSDGGYLFTGGVDKSDVLKLNKLGEKEWEYNLGDEFIKKFSFKNSFFSCRLARETPSGEYVIMVMGVRDFGGWISGSERFFTIKLTRDGKLSSVEAIPNRAGKSPYLDIEGNHVWLTTLGIQIYPRGDVVLTRDGGYAIVAPFFQDSSTGLHLVKIDTKGSFVWEKNLCRDKNVQQKWEKEIVCSDWYVKDMIQSQDGGYVITDGADDGTWLIKTDITGNIEWIQSYPQDTYNSGWSLLQMSDGGYLVAGDILIDNHHTNGMLIKTNRDGVFQWSRQFGGDLKSRFTTIRQGSNNEIIILGWIDAFRQVNVWLLGIALK